MILASFIVANIQNYIMSVWLYRCMLYLQVHVYLTYPMFFKDIRHPFVFLCKACLESLPAWDRKMLQAEKTYAEGSLRSKSIRIALGRNLA